MDNKTLTVQVDVRGVPELVAEVRVALAKYLRTAAKTEPPAVQRFAARVAADFEAGQG